MSDNTTRCPCYCHRPEVIEEHLRRQLADENAAVLRRIRETSWDVSAAADWSQIAARPTHAELTERRNRWGYSDPKLEAWRLTTAEHFAQCYPGPSAPDHLRAAWYERAGCKHAAATPALIDTPEMGR